MAIDRSPGAELGLCPRDDPLSYPGEPPAASGVLTGDGFDDLSGGPWGRVTADEVLRARGAAPMAERLAVVAVGSNASPAQLLAKFRPTAASPVVPLTWATVPGVRVGVAAFVSRWGYVPAAPVFDARATSRMALTWLDADQLAVVDATEGGYDRRTLHRGGPGVRLETGEPVGACEIYVSRTGVLADAGDGTPLPLVPQRVLIARLLAAAGAELAELTGGTPDGFVTAARDADRRGRLAAALRAAPCHRVVRSDPPTSAGLAASAAGRARRRWRTP